MTEVEEIKQKLDIVDVIGQYVSLKKSGKNYKGLCPFHGEKTPSFMVNQELQIFKCFGCNEAGDVFSFVQKMEGYDFRQALEDLAERAGVKLKELSRNENSEGSKSILFEINEVSKKFYHYVLLNHQVGKTALDYLINKRKLTQNTIKEWELGYAPNSWTSLLDFLVKQGYQEKDLLKSGAVIPDKFERKSIDRFRGRVMFPLKGVDGKVLGFGGRVINDREPKYLNTQETSVFHKENFLFGLNKTRMEIKSKGAVVVEGYMDAIGAYQAGITNIVATCGTALTMPHLKILSRYSKDLTFCFDSDNAGINATLRAIEMCAILDLNPKVAQLPEGVKDIDDLARQGSDKVKKMLSDAMPAYDFVIKVAENKNDKTSAIGKKKIMEEVCYYLSKTANPVIREHYAQILGKELSVNPDSIIQYIQDKEGKIMQENITASVSVSNAKSPQEYLLALIFSQENLDKSRELLQNLTPGDLGQSQLSGIYAKLLEFLEKKGKLSVKSFVKTLKEDDLVKARELSLWDIGDFSSLEETYIKELEETIKRVKKESSRKEMANISQKISRAEQQSDSAQIKKLTKEFEKLSKNL